MTARTRGKPYGVRSADEHATNAARQRELDAAKPRVVRCENPDHGGQKAPCRSCAGDHKAGEHRGVNYAATCPYCTEITIPGTTFTERSAS